MKYKALILDLDGTIVKPNHKSLPSISVINSVSKAKKHIKISLATGRPYYYSKHIIEKLEIDQPCVVNGGSEIVDPKTGKIIFKKYLPVETQKEIVKIALPFKYPVHASGEKIEIKKVSDIKDEMGKIIILGVRPKDAIEIIEELTAVNNIKAYPTLSWEGEDVLDVHVTNALGTKKHGVEKLVDILGIKKSEVIGVGDGHNDLPLLLSVGLKIAMGNSPKELKEIADYVAPSIADDGVSDVIEKFVIN